MTGNSELGSNAKGVFLIIESMGFIERIGWLRFIVARKVLRKPPELRRMTKRSSRPEAMLSKAAAYFSMERSIENMREYYYGVSGQIMMRTNDISPTGTYIFARQPVSHFSLRHLDRHQYPKQP